MNENLAVFFSSSNLGARARLSDGREIDGLFDQPSEDALGMQGRAIVFRCPEASLPDPTGHTLIIGSASYVVRRARSDGRGVWRLELEVV